MSLQNSCNDKIHCYLVKSPARDIDWCCCKSFCYLHDLDTEEVGCFCRWCWAWSETLKWWRCISIVQSSGYTLGIHLGRVRVAIDSGVASASVLSTMLSKKFGRGSGHVFCAACNYRCFCWRFAQETDLELADFTECPHYGEPIEYPCRLWSCLGNMLNLPWVRSVLGGESVTVEYQDSLTLDQTIQFWCACRGSWADLS